ncbi:acyl carrier protein [Candidatus Scalindua japonica]|uniref:Acyl carrier protein n=1 Tax=Candidatus Scalindua japonica TaxID=1284222 RepID=A0A286TUX9_9BACT|nr:acyl carrier protein [Candidatus Scalindua japonica]GAX59673.1 acyl carrier protein [Candidatus Scalindua japonica]
MYNLTNECIGKTLMKIVEDLIQDWGLELDEGITNDTFLVKDLDFASVDIIQLCVALEQNYDRKLGFQDLLMNDGNYVSDLTIAQITDFLVNTMGGG